MTNLKEVPRHWTAVSEPTHSDNLSITLPPDMKAEIIGLADAEGVSRAWWCRRALAAWIAGERASL